MKRYLLFLLLVIGANATAMTVGDFITYKAMTASADDKTSPLKEDERKKIHAMGQMVNQYLGGVIDGAVSFNNLSASVVKNNKKLICYPSGTAIDVKKFSDEISDYYEGFEESKRTSVWSQRLSYFSIAFLIKTHPCK